MNLLIAKIATLIIIIQNYYVFLMSIKEGIDTDSLLWLLPALISSTILWSVYKFLKNKNYQYKTLIFLFCTFIIIGVMEFLLPVSPFKTTYQLRVQQKAINSIVVSYISDEVLLSENNNPIGIRIKYSAQIPEGGIYGIAPYFLDRNDNSQEPYQVQMARTGKAIIEPAPSKYEDDPLSNKFKADTVYNFTADFIPKFLVFNNGEKVPCIDFYTENNFTETDLKKWLEESISTQYRTSIRVYNNRAITAPGIGKDFVTNHSYNIKDFYLSALKEGAKECDFRNNVKIGGR